MSGKKSFSAIASRAFGSSMSSHSSESKKPDRSSNDNQRANSSRSEGSRGMNNHEKAERTRPSVHIDRFFHVKPDRTFEPGRSHSAPDRHIKFFAPDRSNKNDRDRPVKTFTPGRSSFNEHDRPVRTLTSSRSHNNGPDRQVRTLIPDRLHNNDRDKPTKTFTPGRSIFGGHDRQVTRLTPGKSNNHAPDKQIRSAFHSKPDIGTRQVATVLRPHLKAVDRMVRSALLVNKPAGSPKSHQTARMEHIADQRHDRTLNLGNRPLQLKSGSRARPDITTNPDRLTLFGNMKMRDKIVDPRPKQLSTALKVGARPAGKTGKSMLSANKRIIDLGKPPCEVAYCPEGHEDCCVMPRPRPPEPPECDWRYDPLCHEPPRVDSIGRPWPTEIASSKSVARNTTAHVASAMPRSTGHPSPQVLQNRSAGGTTRAMSLQNKPKASITTTRRDIIMSPRLANGNSSNQNIRSGFKALRADVEMGDTDAPSENNPDSGGSNDNNTAGNGSGNKNGSGNNIGSGNTVIAEKPTVNIINIDAGGCSGPRGGGSGSPGGAGSSGPHGEF